MEYLLALAQILFTHGMADGKVGLSIEDIVYSYYGNRLIPQGTSKGRTSRGCCHFT